jgi:hypothetical protein
MSFRNLSLFFQDISALISVRERQTGILGIQRKRTRVQHLVFVGPHRNQLAIQRMENRFPVRSTLAHDFDLLE